MMKLCLLLVPILFAGAFGSPNAKADQRSRCDPIGFVTTSNLQFTKNEELAYLNLIDQSNFSQSKQNLSIAGTLPIEVPIKAQANYDAFSKWWSSYKSETQYNRSLSVDLSVVTTKVTDNNLAMYRACLTGYQGLSSFLTINGNQGLVEVAWHPAPPVPGQVLPPSVQVTLLHTHGNAVAASESTVIVVNGSIQRSYTLIPGEPFELDAEIPGVATTSVSALIPRVFTCSIVSPIITETLGPLQAQGRNNEAEKNLQASGNDWKAELEKLGRKNVVVSVLSRRESHTKDFWGHPTYTYTYKWKATYGGERTYGPDPTCTSDEPQPKT